MKLTQLLHTAARRYCRENAKLWAERYCSIIDEGRNRAAGEYHYTSEALDIFPRYNILNAIRVEVERLDPEKIEELASLREMLILAGAIANDVFTSKPVGRIDAAAMASERSSFSDFIREISEDDLRSVQPLPYQRVLSKSESEILWNRLSKRWRITDHYWFPLTESTLPDVAAFQYQHFHECISSPNIVSLLSSRGVSRVWELRESGPEYEMEVSLIETCYNGDEGFWSSGDLDWIVYASHEGSVTVGGWLLKEIKDKWPEWKQWVWKSPYV